MSQFQRSEKAASIIRERTDLVPEIALILGSGLGDWANTLQDTVRIPYSEIPDFPTSSVEGHAGQFVLGRVGGRTVIVMQGRVHLYEGYAPHEVAFPLRAMWQLGARTLLVTNAAGSVRTDLTPGTLMLIRDHINVSGMNPLVGPNEDAFGTRFPDMTNAYDDDLRELGHRVAEREGINVQEGVYAGMLGPTYETPAEICMLRTLGADAVGMSTVPEVIVAKHLQMKVLGISCVTNMGAGLGSGALHHGEVQETADRVRVVFAKLLDSIVAELPNA